MFSEWNLFTRDRFLGFATAGRIRAGSEELDPLSYDFRALTLSTRVLGLEFPRP
jgi:hypothetical protein